MPVAIIHERALIRMRPTASPAGVAVATTSVDPFTTKLMGIARAVSGRRQETDAPSATSFTDDLMTTGSDHLAPWRTALEGAETARCDERPSVRKVRLGSEMRRRTTGTHCAHAPTVLAVVLHAVDIDVLLAFSGVICVNMSHATAGNRRQQNGKE